MTDSADNCPWICCPVCTGAVFSTGYSQSVPDHSRSTKVGPFWQDIGILQRVTLAWEPHIYPVNPFLELCCPRPFLLQSFLISSHKGPTVSQSEGSLSLLLLPITVEQLSPLCSGLKQNKYLFSHSVCGSGIWQQIRCLESVVMLLSRC